MSPHPSHPGCRWGLASGLLSYAIIPERARKRGPPSPTWEASRCGLPLGYIKTNRAGVGTSPPHMSSHLFPWTPAYLSGDGHHTLTPRTSDAGPDRSCVPTSSNARPDRPRIPGTRRALFHPYPAAARPLIGAPHHGSSAGPCRQLRAIMGRRGRPAAAHTSFALILEPMHMVVQRR